MKVTVRWQREGDGHELLRTTTAEVTGASPTAVELVQVCARCGGPHGQPRVRIEGEQGPAVSLTHAGGFVAVAVATAPVGIDLEPLDRSHADIEAVLLSPAEQRAWADVERDERPSALLRTWVRKEALLKAIGEGLAVDPRLVSISRADQAPTLTGWQLDGHTPSIRLADLDLGPLVFATVAVLTATPLAVEVSEVR